MIFDVIWAYVLVFLLAAVPFVEAIALTPIAIVGGLHVIPVFLLAILGNLVTVYFVIIFIDKIKQWRKKRKGEQNEDGKRSARAQKLWKKYGLPGLALIGPFFVGSHLTAFSSLLFGGTKKTVTMWMTISIVGWSLAFALIAFFGIDFLNVENKFLEQFFATKQ